MTVNPFDLLIVRGWLLSTLDIQPGTARGVDLEPGEVGIVGDPAHAASGGYHEGHSDLVRVGRLGADYSVVESSRDGHPTDSASALDIGEFDTVVAGRRITLRSLSLALVDACVRGDPRARDIREIIYSPDGQRVSRWDRLGRRTTGDSSHLWHTHISFHRDSEGRRDRPDNALGLLVELITGGDMAALQENDPSYQALVWRLFEGLILLRDTVNNHVDNEFEPNELARLLHRLDANVAAIKARPAAAVTLTDADLDALAVRVRALMPAPPTAEQIAALVHVPTAAEVVQALLDDLLHARND